MVSTARNFPGKPVIVAPLKREPLVHDDKKPALDENALKAKRPPDPNAMLPYVDHDGKEQQRKDLNARLGPVIGNQLAMLSQNMDGNSRTFIQKLDEIDDPELRTLVLAQFEKVTGQTMKSFIETCEDWNNNGKNRDKDAALQLIDDKRGKSEQTIAKMKPEIREALEKQANDRAIQILSATTAHDSSDENMQKIFRALGTSNPVEIEMTRAAVRRLTNGESNLYQAIDNGTKKGDENEAIAMLAGDRIGSARAALMNETDPKRLREVITTLKPAELAQLRVWNGVAHPLTALKNPADRAELEALIGGDPAKADAERLGNLLGPRKYAFEPGDTVGNENDKRRKASNVMKEFEGMSGEAVKAAAEAWNKTHLPHESFENMILTRWGKDDDPAEMNRLLAMVKGDKGLARSIRLQAGMRDKDQEEIEAALAHQTFQKEDLMSPDPVIRQRAEALKREHDSFEKNNVDTERGARQFQMVTEGRVEDAKKVRGHSTREQIQAYFAERANDKVDEKVRDHFSPVLDAASIRDLRAQAQAKEVNDNKQGALELLQDGKLSVETEYHRGKGDKDKAESLEGIESNEALEKAKKNYKDKYGKEMLPFVAKDDRANLNSHELMIDNISRYGVKAERRADLEYLLQLQQYKLQFSGSLENSESTDAGGGAQVWQRQLLSAMHGRVKGPMPMAYAPRRVVDEDTGQSRMEQQRFESSVEDIEMHLPLHAYGLAKGEKDDSLKDSGTRAEFEMLDKGMTAANKAQSDARKRLAEKICKILAIIGKVMAALTANPWLIALIEVGEGLVEIAAKKTIIGQDYDATEDMKMMALTTAANIAFAGIAQYGKMGTIAKAGAKAEQAGLTEVTSKAIEIAKNRVKNYELAGKAAKHVIQTFGQGHLQGKSATETLRTLIAGGANLFLPEALAKRAQAAIGDELLAERVIGEIVSFATQYTTYVGTNVAVGGADGGEAAVDGLYEAGGAHIQRLYPKARAEAKANRVDKAAQQMVAPDATPHVENAPADTTHGESLPPPPAAAHTVANGHHAEDSGSREPAPIENVRRAMERALKGEPARAEPSSVEAIREAHSLRS